MMTVWWRTLVGSTLAVSLLDFSFAFAATAHAGGIHTSPVIAVLLALAVVLLAAKIGGDIMVRLRQPEVLGELIVGIILGNLALLGIDMFHFLREDLVLEILSELGVILLLFEVGLHTTIPDMLRVGGSAFLVAVLGVIVPFFLGWGVGAYFIPQADSLVHVYLGATLTATSVGITARVLSDLKRVTTDEAKIVLGAAVIDDVLGLMVLATVSGVIAAAEAGGGVEVGAIAQVLGLSLGFLLVAVTLGRMVVPFYFRVVSMLRSEGILLATSLVMCFGFASLAGLAGLAPIVGAFTAGLILEPVHYQELSARHDDVSIEEIISPLVNFLVPIFFVTMGSRVNLLDFTRGDILAFALVLTFVAIIGKQVCGLGVLKPGVDRIAVGLGMIPRGEVGLIFASIGASLMLHGQPIIDSATYGAVVIMVVITTLVTPPLIKWRFSNLAGARAEHIHE
jgi:Kef-type K+ transport system membrane component KefB